MGSELCIRDSDSVADCLICNSGKYSDSGAQECLNCDKGLFISDDANDKTKHVGKQSCIVCAKGKHTNDIDGTTTCTLYQIVKFVTMVV